MGKKAKTLQFIEENRVIRARDAKRIDVSPEYLNYLADEDEIDRLARGVYASPDFDPGGYGDMVIVQKRVPKAVFCLKTALQYYEMTTQLPNQIHVALPRGHHRPDFNWPPIEVYSISEHQFEPGIENHNVGNEKLKIRIYSPARTVADCFKFRNQIGVSVAIEALRDYLGREGSSVDEILKYAEICRVKTVIKPYLESLV